MKYRIIQKIYFDGDTWYFLQERKRFLFWKYWKTIMPFIDVENAIKELKHLVKNNVVDDLYTMRVIEEYYD